MGEGNQAPSQKERPQGYWPILWHERKLSVVLNGLAAALFIPSFLVSWVFMRDVGHNELYARMPSSLIATIMMAGAYVLPLAVLYWLNSIRGGGRIPKMLLSAGILTMGLVGAVEILFALGGAWALGNQSFAFTVTNMAISGHGFIPVRVFLTMILVLSWGVVWGIHRWVNPVEGKVG